MGRARRRRKAKLMYIKFAFLVLLAIASISLIRNSVAKYKSTAKSNADVDLAFYMFKEQDISQDLKLESILPRIEPYEYTFKANYKMNVRKGASSKADVGEPTWSQTTETSSRFLEALSMVFTKFLPSP